MAPSAYITTQTTYDRTVNQIRAILQLADATLEADVLDDDKFVAAVLDANGVVDSYVGQRYVVPLTVTPDSVVPYAVDLVIWRLMSDRDDMGGGDDPSKAAYERAIEYLEGIAKGDISLGLPDADMPETATAPSSTVIASQLDPVPYRADRLMGQAKVFEEW